MRRISLIVVVEILLRFGIGMAMQLYVPAQYQTLQTAVDSAVSGDTITVTGGIHSGSGNRDVIIENKSLTILSVLGNRFTHFSLDTASGTPHRWLFIKNCAEPGVQIRGFSADFWNAGNGYGGAISIVNSVVTIDSCEFTGNRAYRGGVIEVRSGTICDITACDFESNSAAFGGAIAVSDSSLIVATSCRFTKNLVSSAGGAIDIVEGSAELSYCEFDSNRASYAGAIKLYAGANADIANCTFTRNIGTRSSGFVGSVLTNHNGTFGVVRSIIAFNGNGIVISSGSEAMTTFQCNNVFGNEDGNYLGCISGYNGLFDNLSSDPELCDVSQGNLRLSNSSVCWPANNHCGLLIGASGSSCTLHCIDSDEDGFGDPGNPGNECDQDNCPSSFNPEQTDLDYDGIGDFCDICTDTDGDGLGNPGFTASTCAVDNCPNVANDNQQDVDGDGVGDACDNCIDLYNPNQTDVDNDNIGDECDECIDNDGDGFANPGYETATCPVDNCPDSSNIDQSDRDGDGIGDACDFLCGDANRSDMVTVSDAVFIIAHIFGGGPPPIPYWGGDANCSGGISISDAVYIVAYVFSGGPAPCETCP